MKMEEMIPTRAREDVEKILEFAKLDKSHLLSDIQCIQFDVNLDDQFKLMEIDASVLATLKVGQSVTIRGLNTDSAVLCTSDSMYEIKDAETSNTLLLLPQLQIGEELTNSNLEPIVRPVCALKHNYFELKPMKPTLGRLRAKLEDYLYKGPLFEQEQNHSQTGLTFEELLNEIQASENELRAILKKLNAFLINGCWRILDFDYMISILFSIIACVNENSWNLNSIPLRQVCFSLQDTFPVEVVKHVLLCFSTPIGEASDSDTDELVQLNEVLTCRACAELVLRTSIEFNLSEFEETWKATVPEGLITNHDQLKGLALIRYDMKPEVVQYFPVEQLPEDVEERFRVLFRKRDKWTLEEITPYLEDLCSEKISVASLLTKYSRMSTQRGIKVYSSRK